MVYGTTLWVMRRQQNLMARITKAFVFHHSASTRYEIVVHPFFYSEVELGVEFNHVCPQKESIIMYKGVMGILGVINRGSGSGNATASCTRHPVPLSAFQLSNAACYSQSSLFNLGYTCTFFLPHAAIRRNVMNAVSSCTSRK